MTTPLVHFGDPGAVICDLLRERLADRDEHYVDGVEVSARIPHDRTPERPRDPYVLVRVDGTPVVIWPVHVRVTVGITVWHRSAEDAHDLAALCMALLATHSGRLLRNVRPLSGPIPVVDADTGRRMSAATIAANLRPQRFPQ
jgi:hypothetical protein